MVKYLLFDIVVVISFVIAVHQFLKHGQHSAQMTQEAGATLPDDDSIIPSQQQHHCDTPRSTTTSPTPVQDIPEPRRSACLNNLSTDDGPSHLKIGELVELYGDESYFAVPATIIGTATSSTKFKLRNLLTNSHPSGVGPEFIHPYQIYKDGTLASCNVGALRKIYLIPCTVLSHSVTKNGSFQYQVSYFKEEEESFPESLPLSRVQRRMKNVAR